MTSPTQAADGEAVELACLLDNYCKYEAGMTEHEMHRAAVLLRANAALVKALKGVIASWDTRTFDRERFVPARHDAQMGDLPAYWTPSTSMVDSEAIAAARAALASLEG